jgi:hypothetical protein
VTYRESKAAFKELARVLRQNATAVKTVVGWPGGSFQATVQWNDQHGFWSFLDEEDSKYWCAYGVRRPIPGKNTNISCEINPPTGDVDRRLGGIFLKDSNGNVYLAHTGKVGGGRPGIGKARFLDYYRRPQTEIEWPSGDISEAFVLGRIGGRNFLQSLSGYLRAVEEFRNSATGNTDPVVVGDSEELLKFTPEFKGKRKKYTIADEIESQSDHGKVIEALQAELAAHGVGSGNNRLIDLYLVNQEKRISHIFEAKTAITTSHIYEGVGQLMLHGAIEPKPHRILVVPEAPTPATAEKLNLLGIEILQYSWKGKKVKFSSLARFVPIAIAGMLSFSLTWS